METKPDGRMYSSVTRRSVAIIGHITKERIFAINEIAEEIHERNLPEFYLEESERQLSVKSILEYVRYLRDLEIIVAKEDKYALQFEHRNSDEEWAQALSDIARSHFAKMLEKEPKKMPELLKKYLTKFFKDKQVPTIEDLVKELGVKDGRSKKIFKWSLYLYADGETCPFDIRRSPHLFES